jgi:hypothetical protein
MLMQSTMTFADVELRILPKQADGYPVEMTLNGEQEFAGAILQPQEWVPSASAIEDGRRLAGWLFADRRLRAAWNQIRGQHPQRRLRLRIAEDAPELHQIPWELLVDPEDGETTARVLAATTATPFSRYLAGQWRPGSPILRRPVKVLVAIASPADLPAYGLQPIEVEAEMERLCALTGNLEVELAQLPQPCTLNAMEAALHEGAHILHLIAHGAHRPAKDGQDEASVLYLAGDDNQTELVAADQIATMLGQQLADREQLNEDKLRLVFLASCETATRSPRDAFRGIAPQLVAAGVPAVVAMQELVPVETSRRFTESFYASLLRHGQVDRAANEGRAAIVTADLPGAAIPVLFMRQREGQLLGVRGQILGDRAESFWQTLLENIADGECTPFLGPGVTRHLLPEPAELARRLAVDYGYPFPNTTSLPRVAQFVETVDKRRLRKDLMRTVVAHFRQSLELHPEPSDRRRTLSEVVSLVGWSARSRELLESEIHHQLADLELPLYLTTNHDNFMTLALQERKPNARREVVHWRETLARNSRPSHYDLYPPPDPDEPVVLHLFGNDDDLLSLVLTEDDYLDYLARISRDYEYLLPTSVNAALASTTLLFLGYRLEDLDLKVIMRGLLANLDLAKWDMLHVAVQIEAAAVDEAKQQEVIRYFQKYFASSKIDVYWGTTHQFVADLHARWQAYDGG